MTVAPHLPYLRRFARALTGSQSSGDAYALAALEAFSADAPGDVSAAETRLALFAAFLRIWRSVKVNLKSDSDTAPLLAGAPDRSLSAITPLPRVAFLLHTMEEFSVPEISAMLDIPADHVQRLLAQAAREITAHLSSRVLIIEDEPIIAMDLEALVNELGHTVTRVARTHREAAAAIADQPPGLVLADIQLADGSSGLDAVKEILAEHAVPVVFITAFPERLLTGERPEPTFLITKPFRKETVKAIISQALFFDRRAALLAAASAAE